MVRSDNILLRCNSRKPGPRYAQRGHLFSTDLSLILSLVMAYPLLVMALLEVDYIDLTFIECLQVFGKLRFKPLDE